LTVARTAVNGVDASGHVKPVVYETLTSKSMFFSLQDVQSRMHILQPYALQFEYTRIMMGFLLHNPRPLSIAMVGLGGGSLAKFCYRYLAQTDITVIEINPHVIALRDAFAIPPDDHRFTVVQADAAEFVETTEGKFDILLADGFDIVGLPDVLCTTQYYDNCYRLLNPGGMLAANLHGFNLQFDVVLDRIRSSFHGSLLTVKDPDATNRVAFAVKGDPHALESLAGVRRPDGFDELAWRELLPSMARVFLASRELGRSSTVNA
jgi:spermidine synthase